MSTFVLRLIAPRPNFAQTITDAEREIMNRPAAHWRPYVETCIELFGADRCIAESNFPVEKMGIGFAALFNALKRIASGCSQDEKAAIFAGTARRVYRLDC